MSYLAPRTLSELEFSIGNCWSFSSSTFGVRGNTSLVLTGTGNITPGEPFNDRVIEDQRAYTARYMTNGDRTRLSDEILYYLTKGAHVVAYVTAGGEYAINNEAFTRRQLRRVAAGIVRAIERIPAVYGDEITDRVAA